MPRKGEVTYRSKYSLAKTLLLETGEAEIRFHTVTQEEKENRIEFLEPTRAAKAMHNWAARKGIHLVTRYRKATQTLLLRIVVKEKCPPSSNQNQSPVTDALGEIWDEDMPLE